MSTAAVTVGITAALALAAGPASAYSGTHLNGWADHCDYTASSYGDGCLYYSQNGGGYIFDAIGYFSDLSGYGFTANVPVRNDAASIGNHTLNCGSTTWVYVHAGGDWNWVSAGRGGNLTTGLRNNEASFDADANCS